MPLEYREITAQRIERQKQLLDHIPNTGTIQNYLERFRIYKTGLKTLNEELIQEANYFMENKTDSKTGNLTLKNELLTIANEAIHNYMKYFRKS